MFIGELSMIPASKTKAAASSLKEKTDLYLGALTYHGQICGEGVVGWTGAALRVTTYLPTSTSLLAKHHSKAGRQAWDDLCQACQSHPRWQVMGDRSEKRTTDWRRARSLYVSTDWFDPGPPILAGTTGQPIPAYLLPLSDSEIQDVNGWAGFYRLHDKMWTCAEDRRLETQTYKLLADPNSELSSWGRAACRTIEERTGLPTYYHLFRHWGRRDAKREARRTCPGCNGRWHRRPTAKYGIDSFEFVCRRCRLISSLADFDDERLAHIGEYRG
ncbi:MAG: DUF2310 family Zn-ribbon-containing protein [Phycisphaerae bacterium]|nr:DUF2310 family Zn-ribbon-containing protein [Phycisphaerae bacterium]